MKYQDVVEIFEKQISSFVATQYDLAGYSFEQVMSHEGGRNLIYFCNKEDAPSFVLRISYMNDRTENDYLAELEFVRYLSQNGASVANVVLTVDDNLLCQMEVENQILYICLFEKAKGMQLAENNYRYREGAPLSENFYNCGKTLGKIHQLSKDYKPVHSCKNFAEKYNMDYIEKLLPQNMADVKKKIGKILDSLNQIEKSKENYGMIHFDYSDGNYNVDFSNGKLTVYDFDNSCFAWYMYDIAELWVHGEGWIMFEADKNKRKQFMEFYLAEILKGYRTETDISEEMIKKLPLFVQATRIENLVDAFEVEKNTGENYLDEEDLEEISQVILNDVFFVELN